MFLSNAKTQLSNSVLCLTALVPILLVYAPRPPIPGSHFIIYPILTVAFLGIIRYISRQRKIFIPFSAQLLILLLLFYNVILAISFLLNSDELRTTAIIELFRPLLLVIVLLCGHHLGYVGKDETLKKGLLMAAYTIILGQILISIFQTLGIDYFHLLYSQEKTREFGTTFRVTGSLGNPNLFAWVVSSSAIIIGGLENSQKIYYWPSLAISMILVIISGSRSLLLIFPFIIIVTLFFKTSNLILKPTSYETLKKILLITVVILIISAIFFYVIFEASQYFPYMSSVKNVFQGNVMLLNSVAKRIEHWQQVYDEFSSASLLYSLFGLGSRSIVRVVDNDFLYVLYRCGWIGMATHLFISFYMFFIFKKSKIKNIAFIGSTYLFFSLILGMLFETLAGWYFPLLLYFLLGITTGYSERIKRTALFIGVACSFQKTKNSIPARYY